MIRDGQTVNDVYPAILDRLLRQSKVASPRGLATFERLGDGAVIENAQGRVLVYTARKFHLAFACAEALWNLAGKWNVFGVSRFVKRMGQFSDDGRTLRSCYGARMYGDAPHIGDLKPNQFLEVIRTLVEDPDSRRAIIMFRWPEDCAIKKTKDQICGTSLQLFIRESKVHAVFNIRSNDVWLGVPYDVFSFSIMQAAVALVLGLDVGSFTWIAGSLHLYERDAEKAAAVAEEFINGRQVYRRFTDYPRLEISSHSTTGKDRFVKRANEFRYQADMIYRHIGECGWPFTEEQVQAVGYDKLKERIMFRAGFGSNFWKDLLLPIYVHQLLTTFRSAYPRDWSNWDYREAMIEEVIYYFEKLFPENIIQDVYAQTRCYWKPTKGE